MARFTENTMKDACRVGNVIRSSWPAEPSKQVNLYQGSGRWGACFNAYGLMNKSVGAMGCRDAKTEWYHADHWHKAKWGIDHHVPLARLHWEKNPDTSPTSYYQELDLWSGVLSTQWKGPDLAYSLKTSFSPKHRDLFWFDLEYSGNLPPICLSPVDKHQTSYGDRVLKKDDSFLRESNGLWTVRLRQGSAESIMVVRILEGPSRLKVVADGSLSISVPKGRGRIRLLIGASGIIRRKNLLTEIMSFRSALSVERSFRQAWGRRWGASYIAVEQKEVQALWMRSLYFVLCSYAPEARSPSTPMGWTGGFWGFHFPQDLSYIHPALLRLGHFDIARSLVEFFHSRIGQMQEMTKRIYGAGGTMWAWEFPVGPDSRQLEDGEPNHFQFEIHNAAYPARMAYETVCFTGDEAWAQKYAWPVILESARFFDSILKKQGKTWAAQVTPSMGQDEFGGRDAKNYLCALFAAEYSLKTALAMARRLKRTFPERKKWTAILKDGLAYGKINCADLGVYATSGQPGFVLGRQKHPVQLNPLFVLPLGRVDVQTRRAYELRHRLCRNERDETAEGGRGYHYHGWTLVAYQLAAVNAGDAHGLEHEWKQMLPGQYVDPDRVQIYESSPFWGPYYTTNMGLFLQAITDAVAGDFSGKIRIGQAWPKNWGGASFHRLHFRTGKCLNGEGREGKWKVKAVP